MEAEYHENCVQYISKPDNERLRALNASLRHLDSRAVDVAETQSIIKLLQECDDALLACAVILRFRLLSPENQWIGATLDNWAKTFRVASSSLSVAAQYDPQLIETTLLWTEVVQKGLIEDHLCYPLLAGALPWVFGDKDPTVARRMIGFVADAYVQLGISAREEIVHQIISEWLKTGGNLCDLLLKLIAKTGQVPMIVWDDSSTFKSRSTLESAASVAHSRSKELARLVSRRLIDIFWSKPQSQRSLLDTLLDDCIHRCKSAHWASAEVFLSAFIAILFRFSSVWRGQKYTLFLLETLKVIYSGLPTKSDKHCDVAALVSGLSDRETALYLASRQMVETDQPYFDFYEALKRPKVGKVDGWTDLLGKWPISAYKSRIADLLCNLADQNPKENVQVCLFKVLEIVVVEEPARFNPNWLDSIASAVPAVCDAFMPIALHMYKLTGDQRILEKLALRAHGPGASQFKKRLLSTVMEQSVQLCFKWQTLLLLLLDSDSGVRNLAQEKGQEWVRTRGITEELASALVDAERGHPTVQRGLTAFMHNLDRADISYVQALVSRLLRDNNFQLALVFISSDGRVTPTSSIRPLYTNGSEAALRILKHAFAARPRLIIPSNLSDQMFTGLMARLKTANENEMDSIGSILGQLVTLSGRNTQEQRRKILSKVFTSSVALICSKHEHTVFTQAVLIASAARFWPIDPQNIVEFTHMLIDLEPSESQSTQLLFVRSIFGMVSHKEKLLTDSKVEKYFDSFEPNSEKSLCLMRQLLKILWTPDADSVSALLLQRHIHRLIAAAYTEDLNALRIIVKAIDDNLIVAEECTPLITAMSFSENSSVAVTALRSFATICSRSRGHIGANFVEGLYRLPSKVTKRNPLPRMWSMLSDHSELLDHLVVLLNGSTDLRLLVLLLSGLMDSNLSTRDAKHLVQLLEEQTGIFDPSSHTEESIAQVCLVFIFGLWMRRKYGLDKATAEELEAMDCDRLYTQLMDLGPKGCCESIWRLSYYGSPQMDKIFNNKRVKVEEPLAWDD